GGERGAGRARRGGAGEIPARRRGAGGGEPVQSIADVVVESTGMSVDELPVDPFEEADRRPGIVEDVSRGRQDGEGVGGLVPRASQHPRAGEGRQEVRTGPALARATYPGER